MVWTGLATVLWLCEGFAVAVGFAVTTGLAVAELLTLVGEFPTFATVVVGFELDLEFPDPRTAEFPPVALTVGLAAALEEEFPEPTTVPPVALELPEPMTFPPVELEDELPPAPPWESERLLLLFEEFPEPLTFPPVALLLMLLLLVPPWARLLTLVLIAGLDVLVLPFSMVNLLAPHFCPTALAALLKKPSATPHLATLPCVCQSFAWATARVRSVSARN